MTISQEMRKAHLSSSLISCLWGFWGHQKDQGSVRSIFHKKEKKKSAVVQLCPTLWDPVDCSLPGSSVHGILQARTLEWVAISFSGGSSRPTDWTWVFVIGGRCFNLWATREVSLERRGFALNQLVTPNGMSHSPIHGTVLHMLF